MTKKVKVSQIRILNIFIINEREEGNKFDILCCNGRCEVLKLTYDHSHPDNELTIKSYQTDLKSQIISQCLINNDFS